jgi:hypothetical protein
MGQQLIGRTGPENASIDLGLPGKKVKIMNMVRTEPLNSHNKMNKN